MNDNKYLKYRYLVRELMLNNDKSKKELAGDLLSERSLEDYVSKLYHLFRPDRLLSDKKHQAEADRYKLSFDHQIMSVNPLFKFHSTAVSATLGNIEEIKKSKRKCDDESNNKSHIEFYKCIFDCVTENGITHTDLVSKINDYANPESSFLNYKILNEWIDSAINLGLIRCELHKQNSKAKETKIYYPGGMTFSKILDILVDFDDEDSDIKADFRDFVSYMSMTLPLGSIGYRILQMLGMDNFSLSDFEQNIFAYHNSYIVSTLDESIVYTILEAARRGFTIEFSGYTPENFEPHNSQYPIRAIPLMVRQSSKNGCQYGLFYDPSAPEEDSLFSLRIDKIKSLFVLKEELGISPENFARIKDKLIRRAIESWGCRVTAKRPKDLVRILLRVTERHSIARLINEKRQGSITEVFSSDSCHYVIYETHNEDLAEMQSWLKTHIAQIIKIECSDQSDLKKVFDSDLTRMCTSYKIDISLIKSEKYIKKGYGKKASIKNPNYESDYKIMRNSDIPSFINDCISDGYIELFKRKNAITTHLERRWLLTALRSPKSKLFLKTSLIEQLISELYKSDLSDLDLLENQNIYQCFDCNNDPLYADWIFSDNFNTNYKKLIKLCRETHEDPESISESNIIQIKFIPKKVWLDYMMDATSKDFIEQMGGSNYLKTISNFKSTCRTGIPIKIEYDLCEGVSRLLFLSCNPNNKDQTFRIEKIILNNIISIQRSIDVENKDAISTLAFEKLKSETDQAQWLKNVFCTAKYRMCAVFVKVYDRLSKGNQNSLGDSRDGKMRLMTAFSAYRVQSIRNDDNSYFAAITFCQADYLQIVVRLLGFGPCIEVLPYDDNNFMKGLLVKKNSPEYDPTNDAISTLILKTVASLKDGFEKCNYFYELSKSKRQIILDTYANWQTPVYEEIKSRLNRQVCYMGNTTNVSMDEILKGLEFNGDLFGF